MSTALAGVVVSDATARRLSSEERHTLVCDVGPDDEVFRADNDPPHLDEHGIVAVGAVVERVSMLVRKMGPYPPDVPEEKRLLAAIFGEATRPDRSLRCPASAAGRVVDVRVTRDGGRVRRVEVDTLVAYPITIGDVLESAGAQAVVTGIAPGPDAAQFTRCVARARETLHARSIGPYSLVTQQPLGTKDAFGGQRVTANELAVLLARGARHVVLELLTSKADDVTARVSAYESIIVGTPSCTPTTPRATRVLECALAGLGFDVDFAASAADEAPLSLGFLDDARIRQRMPGIVKKPETVHFEPPHAPLPGGLFCPALFDADDAKDSLRTMAQIDLGMPVLHPFAFDAACEALSLAPSALQSVLDCDATLTGAVPLTIDETGGFAVQRSLAALGLGAWCVTVWPVVPPAMRPLVPLEDGKWATSDLNELYRVMIVWSSRRQRLTELAAPLVTLQEACRKVQRAVAALVDNGARERVSLDERLLVSLVGTLQGPRGQLAQKLLSKCVDYSAVAHVVPVDGLDATHVRVPRDAVRELFRPWTYFELERRGLASTIKKGKALVEARDPNAADALRHVSEEYPVLVMFDDARVAALTVEAWDEPAFGVAPSLLDALRVTLPTTARLHVPVSRDAVNEVRAMVGRVVHDLDAASATWAAPTGWLGRAAVAERIGPVLFEAARSGAVDPLTDPQARVVLGRIAAS